MTLSFPAESRCDTPSITVARSEDTKVIDRNDIHELEKGIFWKDLDLFKRELTPVEEPKSLSNETSRRRSRLLNGLAFLAGLSFGGLAAASTTAKTAKLPPTSLSLNLGSSKDSPYLTAYYNPYPLLPYPFIFPGPLGFAPINLAKTQLSHNDLTPQVISLLENRPIDLREDNEEYLDGEKKIKNNRKTGNGEDEADDRVELRAKVDRNAEEKVSNLIDCAEIYTNRN